MLLDPLLAFGPRRVPALAMLGRLALLRGDRARALELLREARALPHDSLDDRSDGPAGRMAQPRYRKLALESLLEALEDVPGAEAERDDVRAELARLAGPG
jgi:hypothetical protein